MKNPLGTSFHDCNAESESDSPGLTFPEMPETEEEASAEPDPFLIHSAHARNAGILARLWRPVPLFSSPFNHLGVLTLASMRRAFLFQLNCAHFYLSFSSSHGWTPSCLNSSPLILTWQKTRSSFSRWHRPLKPPLPPHPTPTHPSPPVVQRRVA